MNAKALLDPAALWKRCDLNLAPMRYDRIFRKDGGPIDHMERTVFAVREGAFFNFNAFLTDGLRPRRRAAHTFYSDADGGGSHSLEIVAKFKAISEAIERWAFWDRLDSGMSDLFGFDIDPTTTGMAAFPGLLHHRAQQTARGEAMERFALLHWWEGRLHHRVHRMEDGSSVVEILQPDPEITAVVAFEDDEALGTRHYGYGAGTDLADATGRARTELIRHRLVVSRFLSRFPSPEMGLLTVKNMQERRALFFALKEGRDLFDQRLAEGPWGREAKLQTVFDGWIPGDWDRYATVWRCLFEPPSDEYLSERADYFFW